MHEIHLFILSCMNWFHINASVIVSLHVEINQTQPSKPFKPWKCVHPKPCNDNRTLDRRWRIIVIIIWWLTNLPGMHRTVVPGHITIWSAAVFGQRLANRWVEASFETFVQAQQWQLYSYNDRSSASVIRWQLLAQVFVSTFLCVRSLDGSRLEESDHNQTLYIDTCRLV